ncbi:GNAT family N-acetyltransferase [Ferrimonas senticii]|uniref:GNAT family N-acetyltransferase n=1 Tax=Ferrimonas senticii TaxID=394566 RepID=UPI000425D6C1|nr:GNAT family N-acetyltransferase [Ferrimonas senticii]
MSQQSAPSVTRLTAADAASLSIETYARDGAPVLIRASRPDDAEAIVALYPYVSRRSLYMRFLRAIDKPTVAQVRRYTDVDFAVHLSLILFYDGQLAGAGRIIRTSPDANIGELSCMMVDQFQRLGLGRLIVSTLLEQGRRWGIDEMIAMVHPQNSPMLRLFKSLGYPCQIIWEEGDYLVRIDNRLAADFEQNPPPPPLIS